MLILNIEVGDGIVIADLVRVSLSRSRQGALRFVVEAPKEVVIMRDQYLRRQPHVDVDSAGPVPKGCFGLFDWQLRDWQRTKHPIEQIGLIEVVSRGSGSSLCCYLRPTSPAGIHYCLGWLAGRGARWFETKSPKLVGDRENAQTP